MNKWQRIFPWGYHLFMKIAEPRTVRLLHFGIYIALATAGAMILLNPPRSFENILGVALLYMFGVFVFGGAAVAAVAVLPGIWWLERVGLIALGTGMGIYIIIIVCLGTSPIGLSISIAFILTFILRWREIRRYQLAPREG